MFKVLRDFAVKEFFFLRVAQVKKAKDFFADELHTRAVEVRQAKEAVESARAGLSPQKGDVRKKRKENEKDQGRWSVATRRGHEKEEKKKTKEGEKAAPQRQGSVCP